MAFCSLLFLTPSLLNYDHYRPSIFLGSHQYVPSLSSYLCNYNLRKRQVFFCQIMMKTTSSKNTTNIQRTIDAERFYSNYYGHPVDDLQTLIESKPDASRVIYMVGDSTFDNKHWLKPLSSSIQQHPNFLLDSLLSRPEHIRKDVCFHLSSLFPQHQNTIPLNCAIEASTINDRFKELLPHDCLVRDNINKNDILMVSVGGNDVAMGPSFKTAISVLGNVYLGNNNSYGMKHLQYLFRDMQQQYINQLISKTIPRAVIICMLYFPDQNFNQDKKSWANFTLRALNYHKEPWRLQNSIRKVYENAVQQIQVQGQDGGTCTMKFVPFFTVMDGKDEKLYIDRVEPSEEGGKIMAKMLFDVIKECISEDEI